jgi:hypothetical protein
MHPVWGRSALIVGATGTSPVATEGCRDACEPCPLLRRHGRACRGHPVQGRRAIVIGATGTGPVATEWVSGCLRAMPSPPSSWPRSAIRLRRIARTKVSRPSRSGTPCHCHRGHRDEPGGDGVGGGLAASFPLLSHHGRAWETVASPPSSWPRLSRPSRSGTPCPGRRGHRDRPGGDGVVGGACGTTPSPPSSWPRSAIRLRRIARTKVSRPSRPGTPCPGRRGHRDKPGGDGGGVEMLVRPFPILSRHGRACRGHPVQGRRALVVGATGTGPVATEWLGVLAGPRHLLRRHGRAARSAFDGSLGLRSRGHPAWGRIALIVGATGTSPVATV